MGNCAGTKSKSKFYYSGDASDQSMILCAICCERFNLVDKIPLLICFNQHNCCEKCYQNICDLARHRGANPSCPNCRLDISKNFVKKNRVLCTFLQNFPSIQNQQTQQQKIKRILQEARQKNYQKVIYNIEKGLNLMNIKELFLWNEKIECIIDLSLFPMLETLDLHKNNIQKIQNIKNLSQLKFLNLSYNNIKKIQNLQNKSKLQILDLCHNQIRKIQNIECLQSLNTLNLSNNCITKIQNVYCLKSLMILYIKFNQVDAKNNSGALKALKDRSIIVNLAIGDEQTEENQGNLDRNISAKKNSKRKMFKLQSAKPISG